MKFTFSKHVTSTTALILACALGFPDLLRAQELPPPPTPQLDPAQLLGPAQQNPVDDEDIAAAVSDDFEIQTRGPIHEAYAEQYQPNPEPGLLVTKQPPQPIDEAPPEMKPEGDDVIWIPGYWAWDDENEDFMWISGIWRRSPPNHNWVPGYWAEVDGGYRWVSGFWAPDGDNIVYREPPPPSRDEQNVIDAATEDRFWVPGVWQWQNDQYVWRDGYYAPCQENWVWVPARWRWTPSGYIYLNGYWDFRPTVRAMLFAPVVFRPGVLLRPRFVYVPRVIVDPWIALNHFWVRPGYSHYYFGNYYGDRYARWGFQPYPRYISAPGRWDPIFVYYQSFYRRQGVNFHARLDSWNSYYVQHENLRPPINWRDQQRYMKEHRNSDFVRTSVMTAPLNDFVRGNHARFPVVAIDDQVRTRIGQEDARMTKQLQAHRELAERARRDGQRNGKAGDFASWSMPKIERPKELQELRRAGTPVTPRNRDGQALAPRNQNRPDGPGAGRPRGPESAAREPNQPRSSLQQEMDVIRQRFGNDPVRFQQEMDRLMNRRSGQPSGVRRPEPNANGQPLQGSGRTGGLGSPDSRLLPRGEGPNQPERREQPNLAPRNREPGNGPGNPNAPGRGNSPIGPRSSAPQPGGPPSPRPGGGGSGSEGSVIRRERPVIEAPKSGGSPGANIGGTPNDRPQLNRPSSPPSIAPRGDAGGGPARTPPAAPRIEGSRLGGGAPGGAAGPALGGAGRGGSPSPIIGGGGRGGSSPAIGGPAIIGGAPRTSPGPAIGSGGGARSGGGAILGGGGGRGSAGPASGGGGGAGRGGAALGGGRSGGGAGGGRGGVRGGK